MENRSHAFAAGLFALLFGVATVLSLYWLSGSKERTNRYVIVSRQDIGGLNPQAQVRYRGIRVGKVSDIRLDPDDFRNILITIVVDEEVPLTRGTVARLDYQGVTGIAHIQLQDSGRDRKRLIADDDHPPRITMVPSQLDELGESGAATLVQARQLMASLDAALNPENRKNLATALANIAVASGSLKTTLDSLNASLVQIRKLADDRNVQNLSRAAGELGPLLADARGLVGEMRSATQRFGSAVGDGSSAGAAALMPRLNEMAGEFATTSRQLNRVLNILEESPQGLVFGVPAPRPGPGEPGFSPPGGK